MTVADHRTRALLLDAMGTLVHLEPPAPLLCRELRRRFGLSLSVREAERAMRAEITYYRAHMHSAGDAAAIQRLREACAEALRAALPHDRRLPEVESAELAEALVASLQFTAYPDARALLRTVHERGLHTAVVSNWDCSLPEVLARAGLAPWLDAVITSAEAGTAKPAPQIFTAALTRVGVDAREALHVGDSLEEDVAGARAAGLRPVWLNRSGAPSPLGTEMVSDLRELLPSEGPPYPD